MARHSTKLKSRYNSCVCVFCIHTQKSYLMCKLVEIFLVNFGYSLWLWMFIVVAWNDWTLFGWIQYHIQACEARKTRYWCHALLPIYSSQIDCACYIATRYCRDVLCTGSDVHNVINKRKIDQMRMSFLFHFDLWTSEIPCQFEGQCSLITVVLSSTFCRFNEIIFLYGLCVFLFFTWRTCT